MDNLTDIIAKLPDKIETGSYDNMMVSEPHYDRMLKSFLADAPTPLQRHGYTYAGIRVVPNSTIPDGFAVVTKDGRPVGLINFTKGTVTLTKNAGG